MADDTQDQGGQQDAPVDRLTPALERELEELRGYRQGSEQRIAEISGQVESLTGERDAARQQAEALQAERDAARHGQLDAHRRALLAEHRGVIVEDLVAGNSVEELEASVERAQAAHTRIAEQLKAQAAAEVGAGAPAREPVNVEGLSPAAKIAEGLRQRR
jgi:hypothetical protein